MSAKEKTGLEAEEKAWKEKELDGLQRMQDEERRRAEAQSQDGEHWFTSTHCLSSYLLPFTFITFYLSSYRHDITALVDCA